MPDPAHRDPILRRMARSLQAWQRALGEAARHGGVLELGELVGSIVPAAPTRSILNAAALPHGSEIGAATLDELGRRYAAAGIAGWGVWVHEDDRRAAAALRRAGLALDSRPTAMALELASLGPPAGDGAIAVERAEDLATLAQPLAAGYGFPPELLTRGLPGLLDSCECWLARVEGVPAAGLAIARAGEDAGVFMVATAPELRRRGAAGAALQGALLHAREQGCTTSTLQSSPMGRSVYARLGYAELGSYTLWERRPR